MYQTLYTIPRQLFGVPVFGFGWLLGLWTVASIVVVAWQWRKHGWGAEVRSYLPVILIGGLAIAFLLPRIGDQEGLPIRGYGVMLLAAIVGSVLLSMYRARQIGLDPEVILSLAFWLIVSGIAGARVFYIIEYWRQFLRPTPDDWTWAPTIGAMLNITQGGLVVYGSLLTGGLALIVFVRKYRLPGLMMSDLAIPAVVLGMGLGRIGCFLNGCCYGDVCDLPWAMTFPWGTPPHIDQAQHGKIDLLGMRFEERADGGAVIAPVIVSVERGSPAAEHGLRAGQSIVQIAIVRGSGKDALRIVPTIDDGTKQQEIKVKVAQDALERLEQLKPNDTIEIQAAGDLAPRTWTVGALPRSLPVHPTQIYSAIDAVLLCLFLLAYSPYRRREGELTALALTIHPISRFLLEVIRTDEAGVLKTHMTISQNISLALLAGAAVLWIYLLLRPRGLSLPHGAAVGLALEAARR